MVPVVIVDVLVTVLSVAVINDPKTPIKWIQFVFFLHVVRLNERFDQSSHNHFTDAVVLRSLSRDAY